jgi:predicted phage tail protein
MLNKVTLYGELADKYGKEWSLDVNSPAEAIRALNSNNPGFRQFLGSSEERGLGYHIIVGNEPIEDVKTELSGPLGRQSIKIVPVVLGSKSSLGKIIIGAIIIYFAWPVIAAGVGGTVGSGVFAEMTVSTAGYFAASMAASLGMGLVMAGVSEMLAPTPPGPPKDAELSDNKSLGPVNTSMQGVPVPVCYGQLLIGGAVISAGVTPEE